MEKIICPLADFDCPYYTPCDREGTCRMAENGDDPRIECDAFAGFEPDLDPPRLEWVEDEDELED